LKVNYTYISAKPHGHERLRRMKKNNLRRLLTSHPHVIIAPRVQALATE